MGEASIETLERELLDRKPLSLYSSTDLITELRGRGIKTKFELIPNNGNPEGLENRIVIEACKEFGVTPNIKALKNRAYKSPANLTRKVICYLACELGVDRELVRELLEYSAKDVVCKHNTFIRKRIQTDRELLARVAKIYEKVKPLS